MLRDEVPILEQVDHDDPDYDFEILYLKINCVLTIQLDVPGV